MKLQKLKNAKIDDSESSIGYQRIIFSTSSFFIVRFQKKLSFEYCAVNVYGKVIYDHKKTLIY